MQYCTSILNYFSFFFSPAYHPMRIVSRNVVLWRRKISNTAIHLDNVPHVRTYFYGDKFANYRLRYIFLSSLLAPRRLFDVSTIENILRVVGKLARNSKNTTNFLGKIDPKSLILSFQQMSTYDFGLHQSSQHRAPYQTRMITVAKQYTEDSLTDKQQFD